MNQTSQHTIKTQNLLQCRIGYFFNFSISFSIMASRSAPNFSPKTNVFKNSNNNFHKSQELNRFMLSCFLIPSCCQVFVRMKMAMKYPFLGDISKEDMLSILDAFELNDLERLVGIVNGMFFKEKNFITYKEYTEVFQNNKLEWMFCPSGIRYNLEKFNDVKDRSAFIPVEEETKSESSRSKM